MNTDQIKGNWNQLVGKAKENWGRLTDDDWKIVEGKRDQLVGKIQERYCSRRSRASGGRVREEPSDNLRTTCSLTGRRKGLWALRLGRSQFQPVRHPRQLGE
jgi:uncharacterized protein YjbJ (UPF0337 family)